MKANSDYRVIDNYNRKNWKVGGTTFNIVRNKHPCAKCSMLKT